MALQTAFTINSNELFDSIGNMIISQRVWDNPIGKRQTLVDSARVDGSKFGDTRLHYDTDVLKSHKWGVDADHPKGGNAYVEAANLLAVDPAQDPIVQAIVLDNFRQIRLTTETIISARAWMDEYGLSQFWSRMVAWMRDTKAMYESRMFQSYIGTAETNVGKQLQKIDLSSVIAEATTKEEANRLEASAIGLFLANLFVEMGDYSRDFNDNGTMKSFSVDQIKVVFNANYLNKIQKVLLPTIFNKDGVIDKLNSDLMPARYFGNVLTADNLATYAASTAYSAGDYLYNGTDGKYYQVTEDITSANNTAFTDVKTKGVTVRSLIETDYKVSTTDYYVYPADEIAVGATIGTGGTFAYGECYAEDNSIMAKIYVKTPELISSFETASEFFNPRSNTTNRYITWGFNTLEYFKAYPFITVKVE